MSTSEIRPGKRNLITDVKGLRVGNAADERWASGVTVVLADTDMAGGVEIGGGAPGTRDTSVLDPSCLVERIHGLVLSGGSVFGLGAADGVTGWLSAHRMGLDFGPELPAVPVVPAAILFDLGYGPRKDWGQDPPYRSLGATAAKVAGPDFELGNAGAGTGATAGQLKGGLGSTSAVLGDITVGALVAVNAVGSTVDPRSGRLWAEDTMLQADRADYQPVPLSDGDAPFAGCKRNLGAGANTTIAVVACDATLDKAQARRMAIMARDGMARAIRPSHTPFDGDTVFALATGAEAAGAMTPDLLGAIGAVAADCLSRAIGRAMLAARPAHGWAALTGR